MPFLPEFELPRLYSDIDSGVFDFDSLEFKYESDIDYILHRSNCLSNFMASKMTEQRTYRYNSSTRNEIAFCVKNSLEKIFNQEVTIKAKEIMKSLYEQQQS